MLAGISGSLLSREFLRTTLPVRCPGATAIEPSAAASFRRWHRAVLATLGPAAPIRAVLERAALPLAGWLGFRARACPPVITEDAAWTLLTAGAGDPVGLYVVPWQSAPATVSRAAAVRALAAGVRWSLVTNGHALRLLDGTRGWAHQHLEFDLAAAVDVPTTLAVLRALCGAASFQAQAGGDIRLAELVTASDREAARVCAGLGAGVRLALEELTGALLRARRRHPGGVVPAYEQALIAVYRMLFLLFAEARGLVPTWHPLYRDGYRVAGLGERLESGGAFRGTWATLQAIARLAHAGAEAGDLRVTAFNGRLFSPSAAPLLDAIRLEDAAAARALLALTVTHDGSSGRRPVSYFDLGVEQLGSVYEHLLDYAPVTDRSGRARLVRHQAAAARRKATGTFYTPLTITEYLVRRALGPLVQGRSPDMVLQIRVVDPAMGSGAFVVAACRFLAAAYEAALVAAGDTSAGDLDEADRAGFRRLVASRCLYGVDLNPMAVQLARLSLWLTTLAADRPLSFLDHHLIAGDSLVGAGPLDLARQRPGGRAATGDAPLLALLEASSSLAGVLPVRHRLADAPDASADVVRDKERALRLLRREPALARWRSACDVWCAAWWQDAATAPAVHRALVDHVLGRFSPLPEAQRSSALEQARDIAAGLRCCHWPLEFPEVFLDADGRPAPGSGFDAVIGNPPWEMLRGERGEEDAARDRPAREGLLRFVRESGIYQARPRGHVNQYQLFVERAISLTRPGGRIGMVVPAGLTADDGCADLRRRLLTACRVDGIVGFENRRAIFPIHRSLRFVLLTATVGAPTRRVPCRFGEHDAAILERIQDEADFPVVMTRELIERLSGPDLAIPDLRSVADLVLVERLATRFPALGSADGWGAGFGRELNATDDRAMFRPAGDGRRGDLPVVEGRHLQPFRVDVSAAGRVADRASTLRRLGGRSRVDRSRLAYRDVAAATNRVTLIAARLPAGCVSVHTVFCLRTPLPPREQDVLCALLNSYVANYLVRPRVATHVTTSVVERLPVPRPPASSALFAELAEASARLRRGAALPAALAAVHAACAEAYEVSRDELAHILGTFPLVSDGEKAAVLDAFTARARPARCR